MEKFWLDENPYKSGMTEDTADKLAEVIEDYGGLCRYGTDNNGHAIFQVEQVQDTIFGESAFTNHRVNVRFYENWFSPDGKAYSRFKVTLSNTDITHDNVGEVINQLELAHEFLNDIKKLFPEMVQVD